MITIADIKTELVNEFTSNENKLKAINHKGKYYNDVFPEMSSSLSVLLSETLFEFDEWESNFWVDDILLTEVQYFKETVNIIGIVIYGNHDDDTQWVAPLYTIILKSNLEFYFVDQNYKELVTYEQFNLNRDMFGTDCRITKINWKYKTTI